MNIRRLPFSILIPLLALVACSAFLLFPTLILFDHLRHVPAVGGNVYLGNQMIQVAAPRRHLLWWSFGIATFARAHIVMGINLPGFALHSLFSSLFSGSPFWQPPGMMPDAWRAIVSPILCLPAWWFVGRGIDGIFGTRRLGWPTVVIGAILAAFLLTFIFGFEFGMSPEEQQTTTVPMWSFTLWAVAFAVGPIAYLKQRLSRFKQRAVALDEQ